MGKSDRQFDRWNTIMKSIWSYQVFHKYNDELRKDIHQSERTIILKKQLGQFGDISYRQPLMFI